MPEISDQHICWFGGYWMKSPLRFWSSIQIVFHRCNWFLTNHFAFTGIIVVGYNVWWVHNVVFVKHFLLDLIAHMVHGFDVGDNLEAGRHRVAFISTHILTLVFPFLITLNKILIVFLNLICLSKDLFSLSHGYSRIGFCWRIWCHISRLISFLTVKAPLMNLIILYLIHLSISWRKTRRALSWSHHGVMKLGLGFWWRIILIVW